MADQLTTVQKELPALTDEDKNVLSKLFATGDAGKLTEQQQWQYVEAFTLRLGLDPYTQPFQLISANGKKIIYATKTAAEQLAKLHNISVDTVKEDKMDGVFIVTACATMGNRSLSVRGAVSIEGLKGENLANAIMKCETKAFRRAVIRICGLGVLDESETDTMPTARPAHVAPVTPPVKAVADTKQTPPPAPAVIDIANVDLSLDSAPRDQVTGEVTVEATIVEEPPKVQQAPPAPKAPGNRRAAWD